MMVFNFFFGHVGYSQSVYLPSFLFKTRSLFHEFDPTSLVFHYSLAAYKRIFREPERYVCGWKLRACIFARLHDTPQSKEGHVVTYVHRSMYFLRWSS